MCQAHIRQAILYADIGVNPLARRTKQSTALTVHNGQAHDDPDDTDNGHVEAAAEDTEAEKVEKLPEPQDLLIPAALLMAAESASDHKDAFPKYQGVFIHVVDGVARLASSDGGKMFVASFKIGPEVPAWLTPGATISNEGLKARIAMIAKNDSSAGMVRVRYAAGMERAELTDARRTMAFQVSIVQEEFPDYTRLLPAEAFGSLDDDGNPRGREWEPVGINSIYLKHVGEIARTLEAGLPKDLRSKGGMVVRAYNAGSSTAPLVFDFSNWPGVILIVGAARLDTPATSPETAALLAPAIKLTLAALRAHVTRNVAWAGNATGEDEREMFLAKAEGFRVRIADILKRAPGLPALAAPVAEDEPDAEAETGALFETPDPDVDDYDVAAD
jgi:hypothetical protein